MRWSCRERSELQGLVRQFGEFEAPIAPLELLTERRHLDRAEDVNAALPPHAIESAEPCRVELSSGCRQQGEYREMIQAGTMRLLKSRRRS